MINQWCPHGYRYDHDLMIFAPQSISDVIHIALRFWQYTLIDESLSNCASQPLLHFLENLTKQGRKHGYPSREQVGRGRNWGQQIIWAGAVRPKTAKPPKKLSVMDGQTDGPRDGPTEGPTEGPTDWWTKQVVELCSTWLKIWGGTKRNICLERYESRLIFLQL